MARVTIAQLQAELEELRAENEELRAQLNAQPSIQFVREVHKPAPISEPLDFDQMLWGMTFAWSSYDESTGWNLNGYL